MQKIAIIRRNGLGDLLCAYPLVLYLRENYPKRAIALFVDHRNYPLVRYLPSVDEVVLFSKRGNKYWDFFWTAMRYRGEFDMAISAKTSPMKLINLFLFWLKAKRRIAYVDKNWHGKLINRSISYDKHRAETMHQALKGLHTVAPGLDNVPEKYYPTLQIPENIKKSNIELNSPIILITASTNRSTSQFNVDRYTALLNRLFKVHSFDVLIIGELKDKKRAKALAKRIEASHLLYFPSNFDEFMVALNSADLFFIGDGGVGHLGAALGKKQVVLYGETNPNQWHPLSKKTKVLYHPKHVDAICDEMIFEALKGKLEELIGTYS